MANWGVPDYDQKEKVDYEGLWARIRALGGMTEMCKQDIHLRMCRSIVYVIRNGRVLGFL